MQEGDCDPTPLNLRKLQIPEIRNGDVHAFERGTRFRSSQSDCGDLVADIGHLDIVGNDVVIENLPDPVTLRALAIHQQRIAPVKGIQISLDVSLGIEQKRVYAVAGSEIADIVRDHSIQPADAVAAGKS